MGYAVNQEEVVLQSFGSAVSALIGWQAGFANWQQGVAAFPVVAAFATLQAAIWRQVLTDILPGQAGLIVTHGGMIDAGVMAAVPDVDWSGAGGALDDVEGIRLWFSDAQCVNAIVLRFHGTEEEQRAIPVLPQSP